MALKVIQLEAKNVQLEEKIGKLEAKVEQQDSLLTSLLREKNERTATNSNNPSAVVSINGLPSSCADLKMIGHMWSGFYSVMGSAKMESVYCDFTKPPGDEGKRFRFSPIIRLQFYIFFYCIGFQKWIGYVDVKSEPVHFYVQRNSTFYNESTPIPFDLARVNEGNAMDLTTGIFTAPRPGIYFFSFTGVASLFSPDDQVFFNFYLYLNGNSIGSSRVIDNFPPVGQNSPFTLQSTLNLKKGDRLWVEYNGFSTFLIDDIDYYTHFTGFILGEEIAASL